MPPPSRLTTSTSARFPFKDTVTLESGRPEPHRSALATDEVVTISTDYMDRQVVNLNSIMLATTSARHRTSHPTYRFTSAEFSSSGSGRPAYTPPLATITSHAWTHSHLTWAVRPQTSGMRLPLSIAAECVAKWINIYPVATVSSAKGVQRRSIFHDAKTAPNQKRVALMTMDVDCHTLPDGTTIAIWLARSCYPFNGSVTLDANSDPASQPVY
ncbi:hypothetical protein F5141DRAFT_1060908 [Pisolithus sp. B1]|nr:hypothetical protein F5141DRAFT_1060908 [Pisolithus sp. B1]